jgi:hypothetical protein
MGTINNNLEFSECQWESVKHLFLNYHYLKTMPAGIMAVYGLFDCQNLGIAVGGAVFCNGRIQYDKKFLEFSRMYLMQDLPKNSESFFISKCLKSLQHKFPSYTGVVTWADGSRGHIGTIYLASNFNFDGLSRAVKKFQGKNKKFIYERTSSETSIFCGLDQPKKRFKYFFDKKLREKQRNENI